MTNYPYYIVVYFDAGILHKVFNSKKFETYTEAIEAMTNRTKKFPTFMENNQVVVLEYTAEYQGKVVTIFNFGEFVFVNNPINF